VLYAQTWDEINRDWLQNVACFSPEQVIQGFESARRHLGQDWPETFSRGARGVAIAVPIVHAGLILNEIFGLPGFDSLVHRIAQDHQSGMAEALIIESFHRRGLVPEIEPVLSNGRKPDLRVPCLGSWLYVEVARPESSQLQKEAETFLSSLSAEVIRSLEAPAHLELLFDWPPLESKREAAINFLGQGGDASGSQQIATGLFVCRGAIGTSQMDTYQPMISGELRFSALTIELTAGEEKRKATAFMRMPPDARAEELLRREAKQLPQDEMNIIVLDLSQVPGGLMHWPNFIERRFKGANHTRIGAVVLLQESVHVIDSTATLDRETKLIINTGALRPISEEFVLHFLNDISSSLWMTKSGWSVNDVRT
jgi:hypothetical protein